MQTEPTYSDNRPLILLDVDGVTNDLDALHGAERPWATDRVTSNGFVVHIPRYMPALIRRLVEAGDVWWCTTWRDRANDDIASHLDIDPLPVVTDGTHFRPVDWKAPAARDLVTSALAAGRVVYWIEDFYGKPPVRKLPEGVEFIDTTTDDPRCVLTVDHLPSGLIGYDIDLAETAATGTT